MRCSNLKGKKSNLIFSKQTMTILINQNYDKWNNTIWLQNYETTDDGGKVFDFNNIGSIHIVIALYD